MSPLRVLGIECHWVYEPDERPAVTEVSALIWARIYVPKTGKCQVGSHAARSKVVHGQPGRIDCEAEVLHQEIGHDTPFTARQGPQTHV